MQTFRYLFITLFLTISLNADINKEFYIGIGIYNYDKANQSRIKKLSLKLSQELEKSYGYKINTVFIENRDEALKDFVSYEKMNLMISFLAFYLENKQVLKDFSKKPFLFNDVSHQKNQFYLITNKNSNINSLKDLKGKSFGSYIGDKGYSLWLDYITRKELDSSYEKLISDQKLVQKNQRLVLNVYFGKVDFSVVSKTVYEDMILLNPSIKNRVTILKKSKPIFFFGLGLFHKNTPNELVDSIYQYIDSGDFNKDFKELFRLLNAYGVQKSSFDDLKELDQFYNEYERLKKNK